MARLYFFVEGKTEQTFCHVTLRPHLANKAVFAHKPILVAHGKKKGTIHRGGGRRYVPMRNDIRRILAENRGPDVFFTTMIDLYAIPRDFPGLKDAEKLRRSCRQRVEKLEENFRKDIDDRRFIPHIQLHEFETMLFTAPAAFASFYAECDEAIAKLEDIAAAHSSPEDINDGPQTAPSKRIGRWLPLYEKNKPVAGPQIAVQIGLDAIRRKCRHFDAWLTKLESLGSHARTQSPTADSGCDDSSNEGH